VSEPTQSFVTTAVLRQQLILHLLARIGFRAWVLLGVTQWNHPALIAPLATAGIVYDLLLGYMIHVRQRPSLVVRWALDFADVSTWAWLTAATLPYTGAIVVATPLMVVSAIRLGPIRGELLAMAFAGLIAAERVVADARVFLPDSLLFASLAVALGAILSIVLRRETARQKRHGDERAQADLVSAELSGRNDVVTGIGAETIDDLQTSIMALTAANVTPAAALRAAVAGHKQQLGQQTRRSAAYLRDVLDRYAVNRRRNEPAVARHIFFDIQPIDAVRVLSQRDADRLVSFLDAQHLSGVVPVTAAPQGNRSDQLTLDVAGHQVIFTPARTPVRLTLIPIAILGFALYILSLSDNAYMGTSLAITATFAAAMVVYAGVCTAASRMWGSRVEPLFAIGGLVPFWLLAGLVGDVRAPDSGPGLPLTGPLVGLALLLGTVLASKVARVAAAAAFGAAVLIAIRHPPGMMPRMVAAELVWPTITFIGAHLMARSVARMAGDLSVEVNRERDQRTRATRLAAAEQEYRHLSRLLDAGEQLCEQAGHGAVRDRVAADLARIRSRIDAGLTAVRVGQASHDS
jgi:hypothetical protein